MIPVIETTLVTEEQSVIVKLSDLKDCVMLIVKDEDGITGRLYLTFEEAEAFGKILINYSKINVK